MVLRRSQRVLDGFKMVQEGFRWFEKVSEGFRVI